MVLPGSCSRCRNLAACARYIPWHFNEHHLTRLAEFCKNPKRGREVELAAVRGGQGIERLAAEDLVWSGRAFWSPEGELVLIGGSALLAFSSRGIMREVPPV